MKEELERCRRVADQMVTAHSILRDRFARRALALDIAILILSAWVTTAAFIDPAIAHMISLWRLSPTISIGLVALVTFCLSLFQLKVDWKQRSDRHGQAARAYSTVKFILTRALDDTVASAPEQQEALERYYGIGEFHVPIPDGKFNRLKQKHLIKVEISKQLSVTPGASRLLIWLRICSRDCTAIWLSYK
jgi:hypothetical protein